MMYITIAITGVVFVITQICCSGLPTNISIPKKEWRNISPTTTSWK